LDPNRMANAATSNSSVNLRTRAYQDLWSFRIKLLLYLLDHGVGVVMNDLDALWLQDPWVHRFKDMPEYDLVASRGEYSKRYGTKKGSGWGSAVCMGFVYFKGTSSTKRFIDLAFAEIPNVRDDQVWINDALYNGGLVFPRVQEGKKMEARRADELYTGQLHLDVNGTGAEALTLTVGMLGPQEVTRRCRSGKRNMTILPFALVEHCHVTKGGNGNSAFKKKQKMLHHRKTWYLKDNYGEHLQTCLQTLLMPTSPLYANPKDRVSAWMVLLDSVRDRMRMQVRPKSLFG